MSSPVVIDPAAIANLRALNPGDHDEFLREITALFCEDMPKRIAELERSLGTGDVSKFTRAAHSIKGSAGNLGALALRDVAGQLEQRSHKHGLDALAGPLANLKDEFDRAKNELTRLTAG